MGAISHLGPEKWFKHIQRLSIRSPPFSHVDIIGVVVVVVTIVVWTVSAMKSNCCCPLDKYVIKSDSGVVAAGGGVDTIEDSNDIEVDCSLVAE